MLSSTKGRLVLRVVLGVLVFSVCALPLACSSSVPTSVFLTVQAAASLSPEKLLLDVYEPRGRVVEDRELPDVGKLSLPSSVVLFPRAQEGELRLDVGAYDDRNRLIGEGIARVTLQRGKQVRADLTILSGHLPDGDGDGVPDDIDNCPAISNPKQGPLCEGWRPGR